MLAFRYVSTWGHPAGAYSFMPYNIIYGYAKLKMKRVLLVGYTNYFYRLIENAVLDGSKAIWMVLNC